MSRLRVVLAQLNCAVGDTRGNVRRMVGAIEDARARLAADLIVFPELALSGYPPEDLLLRPAFLETIDRAVTALARAARGIDVVFGHPCREGDGVYNAVSWARDGVLIAQYYKQVLPNYGVFDERRYFVAGSAPCVHQIRGVPVGLVICEDAWVAEPVRATVAAGAALVVVANASPFHANKVLERREALQARATENGVPVLYANMVGGQDELVFDGGSFAVGASGALCAQGPFFEEALVPVDLLDGIVTGPEERVPGEDALIWQALVVGLRDYAAKNEFGAILIGLSGGIDSALTLALSVEAVGAARVTAVMMPSRYTSELSLGLAAEQARRLGAEYKILPIEDAVQQMRRALAPGLAGAPRSVVMENLQARVRGSLLMALSNDIGALVVTTGNKSEMAVGYATLYGDMAGGFALLKDVTKTRVYELARWANARACGAGLVEPIPEGVMARAPTAELAPGQLDADSLPPYPQLDLVIEAYVERNASLEEAARYSGLSTAEVARMIRRIRASEYKRRQAPPGVRVTPRGFGRDWRYPITALDREEDMVNMESSHEKD